MRSRAKQLTGSSRKLLPTLQESVFASQTKNRCYPAFFEKLE